MKKTMLKEPKAIKEPYAKLHDFYKRGIPKPEDLQEPFNLLVTHLQHSDEEGSVQIRIGMKQGEQMWVLTLKKEFSSINQGKVDSPKFEVNIRVGALEKVLSGKISPIYAMAKGEMRVRGDLDFGKRLYKLLAADNGKIDPCN